jgi:hypothetical protein
MGIRIYLNEKEDKIQEVFSFLDSKNFNYWEE